jgi:hypothetical protein
MQVQTAAGKVLQIRRAGWIRARPLELQEVEFIWPCHFIEQPDIEVPATLGLGGVVKNVRLTIDGMPTAEAAYGRLLVEILNTVASGS